MLYEEKSSKVRGQGWQRAEVAKEGLRDNNLAEILISIWKTQKQKQTNKNNNSCFLGVAWEMHLTFLFIPPGPPLAEISKYIFSFFWLESLIKSTAKVTCSHQEREFQSSKQTHSALQTPNERTLVLELIHPMKPSSCHPVSSLSVHWSNSSVQVFFSFFSRSVQGVLPDS